LGPFFTIFAQPIVDKYIGQNARVTVSTCSDNTNFDTVISVYTGSSCDALQCLTGDDDDSGCGVSSTTRFFGQQNVTYYVRVHGFGQSVGDFELTVEESEIIDSGINDFCSDSNPTFLVGGAVVTGSLNGAQNYTVESCTSSSSDIGLWCK
jgi:hypothetical protein